MPAERTLLVLLRHGDRRRDYAQRAHPPRALRRERHAERAGGGFAAVVGGLDAEVVEQVVEVLEIGGEIDTVFEVEIPARLPEPTQIEPDDAVEPAQVRHPRAPEPGRPRVTVLQQDAGRLFPG